MANLFSIISCDFFKPLTSIYKETYYDVIKIISEAYRTEVSFGVDRETLVDKLTYYFEENTQDVIDDELDELGQRGNAYTDPQSKASLFIRKLKNYGWLDYETGNDRQVKIIMPSYAVQMAETIIGIGEGKETEYQSEIFTIYSLLMNPDFIKDNPYAQIINPVYDRTLELFTALKQLNSNIKGYVETLSSSKTAEEIVADLGNYSVQIGSKPYHRLYTSDNVLKYRAIILKKLNDIKYTPELLDRATLGYQKMTGELDLDTCRENVVDKITFIIDSFNSYDSIIDEIETRNRRYISNAVEMTRFKLLNSNNLEGKISRILNYLSAEYANHTAIRLDEDAEDELNEMFNIFKQEYACNESLKRAVPPRTMSEIAPVVSISLEDVDAEVERYQETLRNRAKNTLNLTTTNRFVNELLADKKEIKASDIPIENKIDMVKVILTNMYGYNYSSEYEVVQTAELVDKNGFKFKDFTIKEKK